MSNPSDYVIKGSAPIAATIAAGQTESTPVNVSGCTAVGMLVPDGMTSTLLAFMVSYDGVNYKPAYDVNNDPISQVITSTGGGYTLNPATFFPWRYIKLVAGTAEAAERIIGVVPGVI